MSAEPNVVPHGETDLPPDPAALIESMRAFGYSTATAVADLIDNSISARASRIDVEFTWDGASSTVAVIDDGDGMAAHELVDAMRLGSRSPTLPRAATDLGRFGLGLKSAAWSQARSLTVLSRARGQEVATRRWDLDHVTETQRWSLLSTRTEAADGYAHRLGTSESGTVVLLEKPDRLVGDASRDDEAAHERFFANVTRVRTHLEIVFHRFLAAGIKISVNGTSITPWDPFLEHHPATQRLAEESFALGGGRVVIAPFVLPHVSKLDSAEHGRGRGVEGWNAHQGFYVYRARRLLVAGGWLGLRRMQQEEHYKLARIRIDLDNSMDEIWQIDVRKATARIPGPVHAHLTRIANTTRRRAADAYRFRGKMIARDPRNRPVNFVWERVTLRDGGHSFRVNRRHPVVTAIADHPPETAQAVEAALRLAEENLPVDAIVMDAREHPGAAPARPFSGDEGTVARMLRQAHSAMVDAGTDRAGALRALATVEPFDDYPELVQAYKEELDR